jgi:glycosyltransferase involved in cell wall biosynthesis
MGVPVVAASRPVYRELLADGAAGWLFDPDDGGALRVVLDVVAGSPPEELEMRRQAARAQAERHSWADIAARTAEMLKGHS